MAALTAGKAAPPISLQTTDGQNASLADALAKGPVVAVFFKVSCPVCQFTFPFIERIYEKYGGANVTFWGISQDDARDTIRFMRDYGIKFPVLIDARGYPASDQYGLTNVPTVFLIAPDGKIEISSVGFAKADLERISAEAARATVKPASPLFNAGEVVPAYKPG
jgi:peroxiredoxin